MESTQDVKEKVNSIHEKFSKQTDFEGKKMNRNAGNENPMN